MEPSGSGAETVEDDLIQEPAHGRSNASSNGAPSAAVPPPPRATPLHLERPRREQAGGGADGSSSAAVGVDRKGKGTLPPKVIPSPPSSAGSSSSSTPSLDYAAALGAGAFGGGESISAAGGGDSSSAVGGSKARVTRSDPVAAETREVPNAAAHPFDPKLVSRQRLIEQAAVDKENSRREQQFNSLRAEEAMYREKQSIKQSSKQGFDSQKNRGRPNEVAVKWSYNSDDEIPYPLYAEFCGDNSSLSPKREWSDVRVVRRLRGLRWQERIAARTHVRELRDSRRADRRKPTSLFMLAMDKVRVEKVKEYNGSCTVPEYLTCPLSGELMIDPVTIATGKTFE